MQLLFTSPFSYHDVSHAFTSIPTSLFLLWSALVTDLPHQQQVHRPNQQHQNSYHRQRLVLPSVLVLLESSTPSIPQSQQAFLKSLPLPILDVIKVYGKLAGRQCFGQLAPIGSTCQINRFELYEKLGLALNDQQDSTKKTGTFGLSVDEFARRLQSRDELTFGWPLKPLGVMSQQLPGQKQFDREDGKRKMMTSLLSKTAAMNKGVVTWLYNQLLEDYQLYNSHNPVNAPLPSSLRPKLDQILQQQEIDPLTIRFIFERLALYPDAANSATTEGGGSTSATAPTLTQSQLDRNLFANGDNLDFYEFLEYLGMDNISWKTVTRDGASGLQTLLLY